MDGQQQCTRPLPVQLQRCTWLPGDDKVRGQRGPDVRHPFYQLQVCRDGFAILPQFKCCLLGKTCQFSAVATNNQNPSDVQVVNGFLTLKKSSSANKVAALLAASNMGTILQNTRSDNSSFEIFKIKSFETKKNFVLKISKNKLF